MSPSSPYSFHGLQHHLQCVIRFIDFLRKSTQMNLSTESMKSGYENLKAVLPAAPVMSFRCRDIGIDCSFEAQGSTEHELMRKFIDHAEPAHNMQVLSADVIFNVRNAIIKSSFD